MQTIQTIETLNNELIALDIQTTTIATKKQTIVQTAITIVNNKIDSIVNNEDYNANEKKAIKTIKDGMFKETVVDGNTIKLHAKLRNVIKYVVIAKKRNVFNSILWDEISIATIANILEQLTVKEIESCLNTEGFKELLATKKTREVVSQTFEKKEKK